MVPGWPHLPAILLGEFLARRRDALSAFCCGFLTSFLPASDLDCTTADEAISILALTATNK